MKKQLNFVRKKFLEKKRGQVWGVDALIAASVFTILFFLYLNTAENLHYGRQQLFSQAIARGERIAFTLTESEGTPSNWTAANFSRIGLADGERLVVSQRKMVALCSVNYSLAVDALAVGEYNLRVRLLNTSGSLLYYGRPGGVRIAYTTAGHDPTEGDASKFGIRNWLENQGIAFDNYNETNAKQDLRNIVINRSQYDTIITEDAHVDDNDLNASQQADFHAWVQAGGLYFNKEHGKLIELFNVTTQGGSTGTVTAAGATDPFLSGVALGDSFHCTNAATVQEISGFDITELVANGNQAQVAKWGYGNGSVYHICDTEGTVAGSVSLNNLRDTFDLYQIFGKALQLGNDPVNFTLVSPVTRITTYKNSTAILEVTLWKQ